MMSNLEQIAPDLDSVTPISDVGASSNISVQGALDKARSFIHFFDWGKDIISEYVGAHFEGIFSIFLFEINPVQKNVDRWVWVVVGDIPPAYITCEDAKNPYEAIDGYVGAMAAWVAAAREGKSVAELIPVNAPATPANAASLDQRLRFIDERLLPLLK